MTKPDTNSIKLPRPNKINSIAVIMLLLLTPVLLPAYLLGALFALLQVSAFCGYKNTESYFMVGLGHESNEQILKRLMKESKL